MLDPLPAVAGFGLDSISRRSAWRRLSRGWRFWPDTSLSESRDSRADRGLARSTLSGLGAAFYYHAEGEFGVFGQADCVHPELVGSEVVLLRAGFTRSDLRPPRSRSLTARSFF